MFRSYEGDTAAAGSRGAVGGGPDPGRPRGAVIRRPAVVDASVVVELLVDLWAPALINPEVTSALRKLVLQGAITSRDGATAVRQLTALPIQVRGMAGMMADAWRLRSALTPYDACYALLARQLSAPLVSTDRRLVRGRGRSRDRVVHWEDLPL